MEDNVTKKQPNLGPYCLQYKLHNKIISKLHEEKRLNDGSLEKKLYCNLNFNSAYMYAGFVKQMCKL